MYKKITTAMILILVMIAPCITFLTTESPSNADEKTNLKLFTNPVDGYTVSLPADLKQDMSNSSVSAVFERSDLKIEIFKQYVGNIGSRAYMNYSNMFLKNSEDHILDKRSYVNIKGHEAGVILWHRNKLERVPNDRNYYLSVDIPYGAYVYSFFVKSSKPMWQQGDYMSWFSTFSIIKPTMTGEKLKTDLDVDFKKNWTHETRKFYREHFESEDAFSWGIFQPDTDQGSYNVLSDYENFFQYKFPVIVSYTHFTDSSHPNLAKRLSDAYANGKILELALQTVAVNDGSNMMYDISNGEYDYFLEDYAKQIADFGHPVLFRLFNEMNGDWCTYCAYHYSKDTDLFIEAYRYIYKIFERQGANKNTIWLWNPNGASLPDFKWNHASKYYPGDKYVQVVGMTAYNTGTYYHSIGEKWRTFAELYDNLYAEYSSAYAQPLMITEFASASTGGNKAAWIRDMGSVIPKYKKIKIAIWWDGRDWDSNGNIARSYIINEDQSTMDAFKNVINTTTNNKSSWKRNLYAKLFDRNKIIAAHLARYGDIEQL